MTFGCMVPPDGNNTITPQVGYAWPGPGLTTGNTYNTAVQWSPVVSGGRIQNLGVSLNNTGQFGGWPPGSGVYVEVMILAGDQSGPIIGTGVQVFCISSDLGTYYEDPVNTFDLDPGYLVGVQLRTIYRRGFSDMRCTFEIAER